MRKLFAPLLGLVLLAPAALPAASARAEWEDERYQEEKLAELRALWEAPAVLGSPGARDLLGQAMRGEALAPEAGLELARWLRDAPREEAQAALRAAVSGLLTDAMRAIAAEMIADRGGLALALPTLDALTPAEGVALVAELGLSPEGLVRHASAVASVVPGLTEEKVFLVASWLQVGGPSTHTVWNQDFWDLYGLVLTGVWLILGGAEELVIGADLGLPGLEEFLPHNLRLTGLFLDLGLSFGCRISWDGLTCVLRILLDILATLALDWHYTTDNAVLQFPIAIDIILKCGWSGCSITIELPDVAIATDAAYVFAVPAQAGQLATRATAMDLLQSIWDRLGFVYFQKPRERTSAPLAGNTPGLGDLGTAAPPVNYYGLQVSPRVPAIPSPSLPGPLGDVRKDIHTRVRADFELPGDSTGVTGAFTMTQIRTWRLNLGFVRWQNVGTGTGTDMPEPPASFYYDAGWHFSGRGPTVYLADYSIREDLPVG